MRNLSPPAKGLLIAVAIFVVVVAGAVTVRETGILDRAGRNLNPAAAEPAPADAQGPGKVSDGTWTVGKDIEPGTYRVAAVIAADANCFYRITKSGTNGTEILAGDIPKGGRPSVTLEAGQDFISHNCGTWVKE